MDEGFIFSSFVNIWDVNDNEIMKISIGMCGDPSIVIMYGTCAMENCILVLIEVVNEDYE
jgi:hypothetical protein